mgnify:CR=1 FL=1
MPEEKKLFVRNGVTYKVYAPVDLSKRWYVHYRNNGKRIRHYGDIKKYPTYSTRMAAAIRLIEELAISRAPQISDIHAKILEQVERKRPFWRPSTYQQYCSIVKLFFEYVGGREPTGVLIAEFFVHLRTIRHPTTYNKYLMHLKQLFNAVGVYGRFAGIEKVKNEKTPLRYFQPHQIKRLKVHILDTDPQLWQFVQFIYFCFIRPKELRFLRASDILLEEEKIFIPGNISKNRKNQYITIPDSFVPSLQWIYDLSPASYLFPSPMDPTKPIGRNTMYHRHKKFLTQLNFGPYYSLYSWKHTGAVAAAKAGISVKELQIQLRHHSLDETDKYLRQMGVRDLVHLKSKFPEI